MWERTDLADCEILRSARDRARFDIFRPHAPVFVRFMKPPVILLGGLANTLALCRSLGRVGIEVTICATAKCPAHWSRFRKGSLLPTGDEDTSTFWRRVLIDALDPAHRSSVLFACNDEAIEFIARNEQELRGNFILERNPGSVRLALLNKESSIRIASRAGLNVPRYVTVSNQADIQSALSGLRMPVLVRPQLSHKFTAVFGRKMVLCHSKRELMDSCLRAFDADIAVALCEYVPGDDDRLCSHYTYIDDAGRARFDFTKRVLRRHPFNFGEGSYHVTEWLPEVVELGHLFFAEAGLRGLGNIEFKRDPRDGKLKFIECNARFTAAHELLVRAHFDIGRFVYGDLTGSQYFLEDSFDEGVGMSITVRDFRAYRRLSREGKLSFGTWLRQTFAARARPYFQWSDPLPLLRRMGPGIHSLIGHQTGRA